MSSFRRRDVFLIVIFLVGIGIYGAQDLLGKAFVIVEEQDNYGLSSPRPRSPSKKAPWIARNWWTIPLIGGLTFGGIALAKNLKTSGYDVTCADGTISHLGGKQGACSHHGGI